MIANAPNRKQIPTKWILTAAFLFFFLAIGSYTVRSCSGFGGERRLQSVKRIPILFSLLGKDEILLFSVYAELYPADKKLALFFINPLTSFSGETTLADKGKRAPSFLESELEDILDTKIAFRFVWTKEQFAHWINLIGGLDLFFEPKTRLPSAQYLREKSQYIVDGEDAVDWISSGDTKTALSSLRRLEIQESVFLSFIMSLSEKKNSLPKSILQNLYAQTDTNASEKEWDSLWELFQSEHLLCAVSELPGEPMSRPKTKDEILKANGETVRVAFVKFAQEIRSSSFGDGERARIEILNGTPKNGLARYGKLLLNERGLKVLTVDNAWDSNFKTSVILNRSGNTSLSHKISETFQGRKVFFALRKDLGLDATVILGEDFQNSKE